MSSVTIVWSMIAAACLTLAALHLPVWWRNRDADATFAFALAAISTALVAFCELYMLKAQTAQDYALAQKVAQVPIVLLLLALAAFAYHYLDAPWRWLAIAGVGLRMVALVFNFTTGVNIAFLEMTGLARFRLLGDDVVVALGVPNPWSVLGQLAVFMLMVFFAHASVTTWRHGRRAAAGFVGGSLTFFMLAAVIQSVQMNWLHPPVSPSTVALFSLGVVLVIGYALSADLLRAKQLVAELGEREHDADLAAEAANIGIWTRDMVRGRISASRKWREMFGFTPEEPLTLERVLERVHPDDRPAFNDRLEQASGQQGDYRSDLRLVLPDGQLRWIAALGRVEYDAKGRPVCSRGACIDISERKNAEQEMLSLRHDIANVGRVSVMGQLSAALAHEINQPLGAILRNAEAAALFLQHPTPDLHEISAILEDIRKDDQRAGEVIDRMRTLLRREDVEMTALEISEVLGDVGKLLRSDAMARHVTLHLDVPPRLPPVHGDRVQIQQVLLNLVLNAMDALEGVRTPRRTITVAARPDGRASVEISVADSGRGIAPDQLARIFEPFFTTKSKGIGMGLSISRSIIESHGGRLWAENRAPEGATFRFTLPIAERRGPDRDAASSAMQAGSG